MRVQRKSSMQGDWVKVGEDINDKDQVTILDEGKEDNSGDYGPRKVFKIQTIKGEAKDITLNQTTLNNLIDVYGDDTASWVGKKVRVWIVKQSIGGKLKNVIYLSDPSWEMTEDGFAPASGAIAGVAPNTGRGQDVETTRNEEGPPPAEAQVENIPF